MTRSNGPNGRVGAGQGSQAAEQTMTETVLITGASSGLGLETALTLARHGFRVVAGVFGPSETEVVEGCNRRENLGILAVPLDITDANSIDRAVGFAAGSDGELFALVNNAGTRLRGCFEDLADSEIRRLFDTNVFGTMAMTRAVIPHMRARRRGRIVMITSVAGRMGSFGVSAYCATKFSQEGFAESLSQELSPWNIHVSIVEPGIIKTEAWNLHRVVAHGATAELSPYREWFNRFERLSDRMVETSTTTPRDVADVVLEALKSSRPRLRYIVGRRARLVLTLRRYVPGEIFDRMYFRRVLQMVTGARI